MRITVALAIVLIYVMLSRALRCSVRPLLPMRSRSSYLSTLPKSFETLTSKVLANLEISISLNSTVYALLSVSGGVDSMAMLHIFGQLKTSNSSLKNVNFEVINFNHRAREEAEFEADMVKEVAEKYAMVFHLRTLDDSDRSKKPGFQEFARDWRHNECNKLLEENKLKYDQVYAFTAHQSDDQLETLLLKFLRGAHITNLTPMKMTRSCGRFIRPLLNIKKQDIVSFMKSNGFKWSEDSSNQLPLYKRNRIRLELIPLMQSLVDGGETSLRERFDLLAEQSAQVKKLISDMASKFVARNTNIKLYKSKKAKSVYMLRDEYISLPEIVQNEVIQLIVMSISNGSLSSRMTSRIRDIILKDTQIANLPRKLIFDVSREVYIEYAGNSSALDFCERYFYNNSDFTVIRVDDYKIVSPKVACLELIVSDKAASGSSILCDDSSVNKALPKPIVRIIDLSRMRVPDISRTFFVRYYREGDQMVFSHLKKKSLSRYFKTKIPDYLRNSIPIITCLNSEKEHSAQGMTDEQLIELYKNVVEHDKDDKVIYAPPFCFEQGDKEANKVPIKISMLTYV